MSENTQSAPVTPEIAPDRREMLEAAWDAADNTFVAEPAPEKPPVEAPPVAAAEGAPTPPAEPEEPLWKRPPTSWKKDYHEAWGAADDKLKEYAWTREEEMRKGVENVLDKAKYADQMQKAIEPYLQTIRGLGIEVPQAIAGLMNADHQLRTLPVEQKRNYLLQLARQYGIDMAGASDDPQDLPPDPRLAALQNDIINVRGQVVGWQEQQEQVQQRAVLDEIERFSQGREHFEALRPTMSSLMASGVASSLEDAYEKALRLDDTLFQQTLAANQAKAEADKREAADRAAKAAKAAAVSVRSSTPGAQAPAKAQDRRALLEEQFSSIGPRF